MKKTVLLLLVLLVLLPSCTKTPAVQPLWFNTQYSCFLGSTAYISDLLYVKSYTPEGIREGLCRDPLCKHDGSDGICPDSSQFHFKDLVTDGSSLYFSGMTADSATGAFSRELYSLNPDGSAFKRICKTDMTGSDSPDFRVGGGYLWFTQGQYDEDTPEGERETFSILRVPVAGGEPETVGEGYLFAPNFTVSADGKTLAVINASFASKPANAPASSEGEWIELTDVESGEKTVVDPPAADEGLGFLDWWQGELWLRTHKDRMISFTRDSGEAVEKRRSDWILYRLPAGESEFVRAAEADSGFVFGGDAVYYTRTESEYLGTKPMPTGRPGEMVDADFFETKTVAVCFWKEGTITEITPDFPEGFKHLSLTAGADGILYGSMNDGGRNYYETGEISFVSCAFDPETVTVIRTFDPVRLD
ncbi:MAG: hypothetical protein IIU08_06425 [Clostridia bacterium]|nr:hypothetical protein [Clostridia bacterium]